MKRAEWFEKKWYQLRRCGYFALGGVFVMLIGMFTKLMPLSILGCLAAVPWFVLVVLIPIYHWKDRYVGGHNNLWGALLVIETSGWSKIIYWFRHIFPDRAGTGRYANVE